MIKGILCALILCTIITIEPLYSQVAYYDALQLKKFTRKGYFILDTNYADSIWLVFNKYYKMEEDISITKMREILKKNIFLTPLVGGIEQSDEREEVTVKSTFIETSLSALSGLDVTNFAFGMSDFLIERAKEELNIAFFQRFKNYLEKYPEAKVLFPETSAFMVNLLSHEYTIWLSTLRAKFLTDLQNIPFKLDDLFELEKYNHIVAELPEIMICLKILQSFDNSRSDNINERHPADIIHEIAFIDTSYIVKRNDTKNILSLFKTTDLISQSLRYYDTTSYILDSDNEWSVVQYEDCLIKNTKDSNNVVIKADTLAMWGNRSLAWVTTEHLTLLWNNETAFRIYMGLLYQQALSSGINIYPEKKEHHILKADMKFETGDSIYAKSFCIDAPEKVNDIIEKGDYIVDTVFTAKKGSWVSYKKKDIPIHEVIGNYEKEILEFRAIIDEFAELAGRMEDVKATVISNKNKNDSVLKQDYIEYVDLTTDIVTFGFDILEFMKIGETQKLDPYRNLATELGNAVGYILNDQYVDAFNSASNILAGITELAGLNDKQRMKEVNKSDTADVLIISYMNSNNIDNSKTAQNTLEKDYDYIKQDFSASDLLKFLQKTMKYGLFMARIVEADDPAEVKQIIQSTALPAGSSSLKKYNANNISINAYLGTGYGIPLNSNQQRSFMLSAPIGICYTPLACQKKGALSVYVGLIDLGAVVNYRLTSNDTVYTSTDTLFASNKIVLGNIISPGLSIVYGFGGNMPLALSAGIQYSPGLTRLTKDDMIIEDSYWRFYFSLTVDLPLYNIYAGKAKNGRSTRSHY